MMEAAAMKRSSHELDRPLDRASMLSSDLELAFEMQLDEAMVASGRDVPSTSSGRTRAARADGPGKADCGGDAALALSLQSSEFNWQEQILLDQRTSQAACVELSDEVQQSSHDRELAKALMKINEEPWEDEVDFFEGLSVRATKTASNFCAVPSVRPSKTANCSAAVDEVEIVDPLKADCGGDAALALSLQSSEFRWQEQVLLDQGTAQAACIKLSDELQQSSNDRELAKALMEILEEASDEEVDFFEEPFVGPGQTARDFFAGPFVDCEGDAALALPLQSSELNWQEQGLIGQGTAWMDSSNETQQKLHDSGFAKATMDFDDEAWEEAGDLFEMPYVRPSKELANDRDSKASKASEDCPICLEKVPSVDMFISRKCSHKICRACLSQYVEVQVKAKQVPVRCPLQECAEHVDLDQCRPHLLPKVVEAYEKSLTEASIPESQRAYCPFANCSALMSKDGMPAAPVGSSSLYLDSLLLSCTECMECHRLFCVECHVPWHSGISCADYQKLPPEERDKEDAELYRLAKHKKWQRCKKCQSVIELEQGCYHMTCRCGFEFCYICGAEWKDKEATCRCDLWDENNIISGRDNGM